MKTSPYYEETQQLLSTFPEEDRKYFNDLWDYFNLASVVYNEVAVREAVYNLALDFQEAVSDGIKAEDYFGKNPKEMADQMLPNFPKDNLQNKLTFSFLISGIIILYRWLSEYASHPYFVVKPLVHLVDIALSLVVVYVLFDLFAATIFASKRRKNLLYGSGIVLFVVYFFLEVLGVRWLPEWGWFILPSPWDSLILVGVSFLLMKWQWKEELARPFILPIGGFLVNGILQRVFLATGQEDPFWTVWIPSGLTLVCLIGFYWLSYRVFRKNSPQK